MAQQRGAAGEVFGFEKQLAEGGVGEIVGGARQHDFGVAGDVDLADPRALIDDRHPPDFDIVFGGDGDVELCRHLVVVAPERRPLGAKLDHIVVGLGGRGVIGRGPDGSAAHVAQVDTLGARIARGVAARLGDGEAAAEAAAAAGVGHDRQVVAIGQKLRVRHDRVRRPESPRGHRRRRRGDPHLVERPRLNHRRAARHALLQQQLGGLHARVGVKTVHHSIAEQRVRERHQRHAGVVREVGANHRPAVGFVRVSLIVVVGRLARGVVDGVEEPVLSLEPRQRQPAQVGRAPRWVDHRGEGGRVRRDDQLVAEPALEAEPRDAECLVLKRVVPIDDVVGGLGDAPGDVARRRRIPADAAPPSGTTRRAAYPDSCA